MSRASQQFRQTDVTKAIRAVVAAGMSVARVEIEGGKIVVIPRGQEQDQDGEDTSADLRKLL